MKSPPTLVPKVCVDSAQLGTTPPAGHLSEQQELILLWISIVASVQWRILNFLRLAVSQKNCGEGVESNQQACGSVNSGRVASAVTVLQFLLHFDHSCSKYPSDEMRATLKCGNHFRS